MGQTVFRRVRIPLIFLLVAVSARVPAAESAVLMWDDPPARPVAPPR